MTVRRVQPGRSRRRPHIAERTRVQDIHRGGNGIGFGFWWVMPHCSFRWQVLDQINHGAVSEPMKADMGDGVWMGGRVGVRFDRRSSPTVICGRGVPSWTAGRPGLGSIPAHTSPPGEGGHHTFPKYFVCPFALKFKSMSWKTGNQMLMSPTVESQEGRASVLAVWGGMHSGRCTIGQEEVDWGADAANATSGSGREQSGAAIGGAPRLGIEGGPHWALVLRAEAGVGLRGPWAHAIRGVELHLFSCKQIKASTDDLCSIFSNKP